MVKIGSMLSEIKGKQSRLSRLMDVSKETMYYEKGKKPKLNYEETAKEIERLIKEIRELKLIVSGTNQQIKLNNGLTIAEAILKIGDLRSLIAHKTSLIRYSNMKSFWDEDEKKIELIPQVEEKKIEAEIEELNKEKVQLDNEIQKANWSVDVV